MNPTVITPLPGPEIYDQIDGMHLPFDCQTFPSTESKVLDGLVAKHQPKVIIEVGSHKGGSASRWAKLAGSECRVYCVDTWLESAESVLNANKGYAVVYMNGHPMTYWQFLTNMKALGLQQQVTPIINTSTEGAIILKAHGIKAPLIFIDGSHTYHAAYWDIHDYWDLLEPGGSMLVDDLSVFPDVYAAFLRFIAERDLWLHFSLLEEKTFGLLSKPS